MYEWKSIDLLSFLSLDLYQSTWKTLLCIMTQWGNAPSSMNFNDTEDMKLKEHFKKIHIININRNKQFLNYDEMWKNTTVSSNTCYTKLLELT